MILEARVALGIGYFAIGVIIGTFVYRYSILRGDVTILILNLFLWPYFLAAMASVLAACYGYLAARKLIKRIINWVRGRY